MPSKSPKRRRTPPSPAWDRDGVPRRPASGLAVGGGRLLQAAEVREHRAEPRVGWGELGRLPDGLAVGVGRVLQASLARQQIAEIAPGQGVGGPEADGLAVLGGRSSKCATGLVGDAEAVVDRGVVGLEPQGLAESGEVLIPLPLAERRLGEEQVCVAGPRGGRRRPP